MPEEKRWIEKYVKEVRSRKQKELDDLFLFISITVISASLLIIAFRLEMAVYWEASATALGTIGSIYALRIFWKNVCFIMGWTKSTDEPTKK
ncbi:hypothetical protein ACFL29_02505 [Patescibacteria group bacterium]